MEGERNINIDILRIISAVAVVAVHSTTKYIIDMSLFQSNLWEFCNIVNNASRYAVPMFFIISGYFTLNNIANKNYRSFYVKKFNKVIIPFFIWSVFYTIFYLKGVEDFNIFNLLKQMLTIILGYPSYYHLWFFYELIGLYIVTPIIIKFLDKLDLKDIIILIAIFILQNTLIHIVSTMLKTNSYINIPFSGDTLFYYVLGGFFGKTGFEFLLKNKKLILFAALISISINIIGTRVSTEIIGKFNGAFMASKLITIMFYVLGIFTIIMDLKLNNLPIKAKEIIRTIAGLTFGIFLIHPFVIDFFIRALNFSHINIFVIIIQFILTCIISTILVLFMKKVPLINKIIP